MWMLKIDVVFAEHAGHPLVQHIWCAGCYVVNHLTRKPELGDLVDTPHEAAAFDYAP